MSVRGPLVTGTVLSLAVVSAWSCMASLAIGAAGPLHLDRNLRRITRSWPPRRPGTPPSCSPSSRAIYAACLLVSGWRRHRRGGG